jgi:hypothetical protein
MRRSRVLAASALGLFLMVPEAGPVVGGEIAFPAPENGAPAETFHLKFASITKLAETTQ